MLKLEGVNIYYRTSHVLQGVSFEVPEGRCAALLGRNGAGKTTTVHSVSGLVPPRESSIVFKGREISKLPPYKIAKLGLGLVPQGRRIFPSLTIRENLSVPARNNRKNSGSSEGNEREPWTLERVYELFPVLKEREGNMGNQLSGGQQQMLAIGRALMGNPDLILMDEPSEGLAPTIIEQVGDIVMALKQTGLSILLVEQNVALACRVADEVLVMNKGQIVWQGEPSKILSDESLQHKYLGV